jgi:hypothetical protein
VRHADLGPLHGAEVFGPRLEPHRAHPDCHLAPHDARDTLDRAPQCLGGRGIGSLEGVFGDEHPPRGRPASVAVQ